MKEIKFRAWDVRSKKMFMVEKMTFRTNHDVFRLWGKEHFEPDEFHIENPDDCILEQFTGFQDSEGKDIYEGDTLRGVKPICDNEHWTVYFCLNQGLWEVQFSGWTAIHTLSYLINEGNDKYKIIGNIHEVKS